MKKNRFIRTLAAFLSLSIMAPWSVSADDECNIELHRDIRVSAESLEVSESGQLLFRIRQGGELEVEGSEVALDSGQLALVENYAGEVSALVPQVIELILEGLSLAETSVELALGEAFGEGNEAGRKSAAALAKVRADFEANAKPEKGVYVLAENDAESMGDQIEADIELSVSEAMGAVLAGLGNAISSEEGSFAQNMEAFGERMERVGEEIERSAQVIEDFSDEVCSNLERVQNLERQVHAAVPELSRHGMFD